jgi:putative PIN family toxin of toxin-antitoxin system
VKIVLDTNVIMSAYLFGGRPLQVLRLAEKGAVELLTCREALSELIEVLHRDKFSSRLNGLGMTSEDVLSNYLDIAVSIASADEVAACEDADDNLFIGIALAGDADFIVSGDKHLLRCSAKSPVPVLRVSEFLALLRGLSQDAGSDVADGMG